MHSKLKSYQYLLRNFRKRSSPECICFLINHNLCLTSRIQNYILLSTAIRLQSVNGLKSSKYLIDKAIQNIEGKITIKEDQNHIVLTVIIKKDQHTYLIRSVLTKRIRYLPASQRYFRKQHSRFLQMNTSLFIVNFFKIFTNRPEKSEIIILQKRYGFLMEQPSYTAVLQN